VSATIFEGIVERGLIRLTGNVRLLENTRVYVVVPGTSSDQVLRVFSPRLARPEQARDFEMEVSPEHLDAGVCLRKNAVV